MKGPFGKVGVRRRAMTRAQVTASNREYFQVLPDRNDGKPNELRRLEKSVEKRPVNGRDGKRGL